MEERRPATSDGGALFCCSSVWGTMSQDDSLVSVIVPVYNAERYICRCLESILSQTYRNTEIICIDDGSVDASSALLDGYQVNHPEVVRVVHQQNSGVAAARNLGIQLARGMYLTFVDNDDWLDRDYIEVLVRSARLSDADIVCSGYRRPDIKGKVVCKVVPSSATEWGCYLVGAAWAKLYRTELVHDSGLSFLDTRIGEDLYFTLPAIELSEHVEVISYCGYNWFWNVESVSNTCHKSSTGLGFEDTLNKLLELMECKRVKLTPILIHWFVRLVVWFLLYTSRGDGSELSMQNLSCYIAWLDRNMPDWREDSYALPMRPTGDAVCNRIAVWLFARHPRLFSLVLGLYGRLG